MSNVLFIRIINYDIMIIIIFERITFSSDGSFFVLKTPISNFTQNMIITPNSFDSFFTFNTS